MSLCLPTHAYHFAEQRPVRVETEHLGNADAYRVTREIPLPYRRIEPDSDEDDIGPRRRKQGALSIKLDKLKREIMGHNGDTPGDAITESEGTRLAQRDYEAGRRLDPVNSRSSRANEV